MSEQYKKFQQVLRELFMIDDAADLDFGIYRIMHEKQKDIEKYLSKDLRKEVETCISENAGSQKQDLERQLAEVSKQVVALGMNPDDVPTVKALKLQLDALGNDTDLENEVYNHLSTFFHRYYDSGDFISQRRYKKDVYAIPYEGEEVKLYWANYDQYYIKTSEYLHNYSFKLGDGRHVTFRLVEASQETNNNKTAKDQIRCFALADGEGQTPVSADGDTLTINFTYELMPKANNLQKTLIAEAYEKVTPLIQKDFKAFFGVFTPAPTDKEKNRSLLQKHMNSFVARNTFDYFIHKDLKGFLSRELDFYIKNEIFFIDDIDTKNVSDFQQYLAIIKAVKAVGKTIITFLSGLEDFQKKLWLKKKFVVESNYCITLDRIDEKFYPEIAANDAQRKEWVNLFAINEIEGDAFRKPYSEPLTVDFLKDNPHLVLDTQFFSQKFKRELTASIDNFDEQCDGLLINSDNFQALKLLKEKYRQVIDGIYYDPPYNTKKNEFVYKDCFKHSSWACMMYDRLNLSKCFMNKESAILTSCDENEITDLHALYNIVFGEENFLSDIIWEGSSKNDQKYLSISHEYIVTALRDKNYLDGTDKRWLVKKEGLDNIYTAFDKIRSHYPCNFDKQAEELKKWYKKLKADDPAKKQQHFCCVDERGVYFPDNISKPENGYYYEVLHPVTHKPCKKPKGGWRFIESTMNEQLADNRIHFGPDETTVPCRKSYLRETEYESPSSVIYMDNRVSTALMKNLFNDKKIFSNPKYYLLIAKLLKLIGNSNSYYMDMFAGSATTGHAVLSLNMEDNGHRKYILGELSDYFYTVTKPRIEKVVYSKDWKDGKPVSREGISQCFKYISLEQYEDTLNNLVVKEHDKDFFGKYSDTYMGYMLDTETKDSLFTIDNFRHPFAATMNITRNNETKERTIDLVETFNYLIGLYVDMEKWYMDDNLCMIEGKTRTGKRTLVIWRNIDKVDNETLNEFCEKHALNPRDDEFDTIYVNGDNNLDNLRKAEDMWCVNLTEEEFKRRMFEEID